MINPPLLQTTAQLHPAPVLQEEEDEAEDGENEDELPTSYKKDFSQQTLACKGCGQIGHTVLLCEEEVTSNELALTCSDCTRTHTLNAAEKSLTTNTILCPYHFNRLAKSAPADPETLRKAKFLVDRVTELQTTTGATLENSLSWLGVPAEEYERCLQIAETEMM